MTDYETEAKEAAEKVLRFWRVISWVSLAVVLGFIALFMAGILDDSPVVIAVVTFLCLGFGVWTLIHGRRLGAELRKHTSREDEAKQGTP